MFPELFTFYSWQIILIFNSILPVFCLDLCENLKVKIFLFVKDVL